MKSKVKFSTFCQVMTAVVIIALLSGVISCRNEESKCITLAIIFIGVLISGLWYAPMSVECGPNGVVINRILKSRSIPFNDIVSVERCYPSAGGLRLLGSGGFLGYWGYFHDIIIGAYFGYYGDRNKCLLLKLKGDKQYVISCEQPDEMMVAIKSHIA